MPSIVFMYFIEMEMQRKRKNTHSNMINKPKVQQKKEKKRKKKAFDIVMLFQFTFKKAVYFFQMWISGIDSENLMLFI